MWGLKKNPRAVNVCHLKLRRKVCRGIDSERVILCLFSAIFGLSSHLFCPWRFPTPTSVPRFSFLTFQTLLDFVFLCRIMLPLYFSSSFHFVLGALPYPCPLCPPCQSFSSFFVVFRVLFCFLTVFIFEDF